MDRVLRQNSIEAVKWFEEAAEQGLSLAQTNLGVMYLQGKGVKKNESKGFKWIEKALEQGDERAKEILTEYKKSSVAWMSDSVTQQLLPENIK